jgi:hypothetical protein
VTNTRHLHAENKPVVRCDDTVASIDTIEVFFPHFLMPDQHLALCHCGRLVPCSDAKGRLWGHRLIVNRPDRPTLRRLDQLCPEYCGVLSRLDIAIDIQAPIGVSAEEAQSWIVRSAILKWRRRGPMEDYDDGSYWQMNASGRRPNRNLVIYRDKFNRVTGELNCVHLELRFFRADTIRRQGIRSIKDVVALNPDKLFARHVKFTDAGELYVVKTTREVVRDDREKYRGRETSEFTDRYRSNIPRMVRGLLHRLGRDRSQYVKDVFGHRKINVIEPPFSVPHELTWAAPCAPIQPSSTL